MKKKPFMQIILILLLAGLFSTQCCKKPEELEEPELKTLSDTLQGEWHWYGTYSYRIGMIEPDFSSTVHFISTDSDSIINYETYKNDTLKKSGICTIRDWRWTRKIEPDILLHFNVTNENLIDFISADTIKFYEDVTDNLEYFYEKIAQ